PDGRRAGGDRGPGARRALSPREVPPRGRRARGDRDLAAGAHPRVRRPRDPSRGGPVPGPGGSRVLTPLFRVAVPVVAHELAEPDRGTGIAMVCTFGDVTDVTWWRELGLPAR